MSAATGGRLRLTISRGGPERSGRSRGGSAVERVSPSAGSATAPATGWLVDDERDVHGPVLASGFAVLAGAVERVDDPHAVGDEALGTVTALLGQDGVVRRTCGRARA